MFTAGNSRIRDECGRIGSRGENLVRNRSRVDEDDGENEITSEIELVKTIPTSFENDFVKF